MSRNDKFIISNKKTDHNSKKCSHKKCGHNHNSYVYSNNINLHNQIVNDITSNQVNVDMATPIHIILAFHFLAPSDTFNTTNVLQRANDIVESINDDFNNYSSSPYMMNYLKYKNVVTEVFIGDVEKQQIYLSNDYQDTIPLQPSNITFELGNIYYYPVATRLNLTQYDDVEQVELEYQAIKQYIFQNSAVSITPNNVLNIWIVDMIGTEILGYSNFPWETMDIINGIVINRNVFFPEELTNNGQFFPYDKFKTFSHEIGHYLGLLHTFDNSNENSPAAINMNEDNHDEPQFAGSSYNNGDYIADTPFQVEPTYDPYTDNLLQNNINYNPLFMNFMDYTYDEFLTNFTYNQVQKMRYMIFTYRPELNSFNSSISLPAPKFNPNTRTISGQVMSANTFDFENKLAQASKTTKPNLSYPEGYSKLTKKVGTMKYNKYGQPIESVQKNIEQKKVVAPKQSTKRFTRTKPIN